MTRILIADDNTQNLYFLETALKGYGYEVTPARDGIEALDLALKNLPDLIITDILMPKMDGFELCRRWNSDKQLQQIPFIFYTATYTDLKDEQFALSLGADRFVIKPQQPEDLIHIIQEVLSNSTEGRQVSRKKSPGEHAEVLQQYNEVLFRKLEKKVLELEQEITRRKQAEDQIIELQQYLQLQIDQMPIGLIVWDPDFKVKTWNPKAQSIFGFTAEEAIGKHAYDIIVPEAVQPKIDDIWQRLLEGDMSLQSINENITKDGRTIVCQWLNASLKKANNNHFDILSMVQDITEQKQNAEKLLNAMKSTIEAIATTVEMRDPYTAGHQKRVAKLACAIANEMGLTEEQVEALRMASSIHDIGKIYVPAEILSKPGELSEIEFSLIKTHPQASYDILKNISFPWPVAQIVFQHHERLDGSGYPQGLSDENILQEAKVLAVADVVEAMSSYRPYRPSLGVGQALEEILQKKGIRYDTEAVDACIKIFYEKDFKFDQENILEGRNNSNKAN